MKICLDCLYYYGAEPCVMEEDGEYVTHDAKTCKYFIEIKTATVDENGRIVINKEKQNEKLS